MATSICTKAWVSGQVQGVSFRAYTAQQAHQLNVTGYARNLPDGRVEVLACGDEDKVNQLIAWLQQGSPRSQVQDVMTEPVALQTLTTFTTG